MRSGFRGVHHAAVNVRDWEESKAFYRDLLGLELLVEGEATGEGIESNTHLPGAHLRFAMLAVAPGQHIELIQYLSPEGRPNDRAINDEGSTHIAFDVPDIEEAYARLAARGVRFNARPVHIEEGPLVGCAFAYFHDPNGVLLEIFQPLPR